MVDTDFRRVKDNFLAFISMRENDGADWPGARLSDITSHPQLDMKPRRICFKALSNIRSIQSGNFVRLEEIAEVVETTEEFKDHLSESELMRLIEGQDIRAVEGLVVPRDKEKRWQVEVRKTNKGYSIHKHDIVVGLVRPERRNIGFYIHEEPHVYASPDGVAVVRERSDKKSEYPIQWIFQALRTEACRIQFWTESGGTSYGKLTIEQIKNVLIPVPEVAEIERVKKSVEIWAKSISKAANQFQDIWDDSDKVAILNSPVIGLEAHDLTISDDSDEDD